MAKTKPRRRQRTAPPTFDTPAVQQALTDLGPDQEWLAILKALVPTGVADTGQLRRATGLSRERLRYILDRFVVLADDAIVARVADRIPRPGVRGRSPTIYRLGAGGATLLRAHGQSQAHTCGLTDVTAIAHARAVLDVRLAAQAAELTVQTERELRYGEGHVLRPDNLVTLPGGRPALFETEQQSDVTVLRPTCSGEASGC